MRKDNEIKEIMNKKYNEIIDIININKNNQNEDNKLLLFYFSIYLLFFI